LIYFVKRQDERGLIKIGVSVRLSRRIKQPDFQQYFDSPAELVVLGVMDGGYADESVLHKRFRRSRWVGEWFVPHDDLLAFIEAEARPWDGVDEMPDYSTVNIKGNEEWKAWLEEAAAHCRLSVSALVDLAVARYAKSQGFDRKPPER
jgi:hypothetical protein